jgi:DNA-binding beta-propeller fold protein YncE
MRIASRILSSLVVPLALLAAGVPEARAQAYHVAQTIKLGGDGGWDYLAFDAEGHRLFIAHATKVVVVNPDTGAVLAEIPGLDGAHGVAFANEANRGFATSGHDGMVTMFDLKSLKILDRIEAAEDDDAILFDTFSHRVFTFNGDARSSTVIDPAAGKVVGTIPLDGKPEFGVSAGDGKLYVNIEDKGEVAEIDAAKLTVTRRWPLAPCESPTGLAIDRAHSRLFSGCRNKVMAISDATGGKMIATVPIGEGVDACAFDAARQLAFASNGDGTLTVVHEESPAEFRVVANAATRRGARTMALDEASRRIYTATAELGPPPAPTAEHPRPRPSIVPGTFMLLVLEP